MLFLALLLLAGEKVPVAHAVPALPPLSVSGNRLLQNGAPFRFHGVNRDSLEWGRYNWGGCGGDGHFADADFAAIAQWKVNVVRLPLSQANVMGRRCDSQSYFGMIDAAVTKAAAYGMYVILDLHWSDVAGRAPCDEGCLSGQQPMPDSDSVKFWRLVAARYASQPGVLFNLYNEPHDVSWACWLNGGCSVRSSVSTGPQVSYKAVGMQRLYDTIRQTGAPNVILVGGLDWAYDLSGVGSGYAVKGYNIVYDTHVYTAWHNTQEDWDSHFGFLTPNYALSATEFGSVDCSSIVTEQLLDYFDAPRGLPQNAMSWAIWSWNAPGECSQPSILLDWSGDPMPNQGTLIHDRLLTYGP